MVHGNIMGLKMDVTGCEWDVLWYKYDVYIHIYHDLSYMCGNYSVIFVEFPGGNSGGYVLHHSALLGWIQRRCFFRSHGEFNSSAQLAVVLSSWGTRDHTSMYRQLIILVIQKSCAVLFRMFGISW
jgi:hypothetical protein